MRRLVTFISAASLACGAGSSRDGARDGENVPFTLLAGGPRGSCLPRPTQAVARSGPEWEEFWRAHSACPDSAPQVDFARQMVLVYALGERYTGAVGVRLDRVTAARGGPLVAHLTVTGPGRGCPAPMNVVYPRVIALTTQREGDVRFEVSQRRTRC